MYIDYTVKTFAIFLSPAGMSLTKLFLAGNNRFRFGPKILGQGKAI
jgi:hypothetical protein